jgi:DNA-binding beta-propeller fold protein YncE
MLGFWLTLTLGGCTGAKDDTAVRPDRPRDSAGPGDSADTGVPDGLPAVTVRLLPDGQPNLLLPIQVGLDAAARRLYVSSNGLPSIAEVDLDSRALVAVHWLPDMSALHALVAPDGAGGVWLGFDEAPALARFDVATDTYTVLDTELEGVSALASGASGGAVAAGAVGELDRLVALDASGALATLDVTGVLGLDPDVSGGIHALVREADATRPNAVVTLTVDTLAETDRCDIRPDGAATTGFTWFDELPGGYALAQSTRVAHLDCGSGAWTSMDIGQENRSVFATGADRFIVLDRMGGMDQNWGLARTFDTSLAAVGGGAPTGKNSGYAIRDPGTGLVWMNSEGTGEVWALDPGTGAIEARVRMGMHVESMALGPDSDTRVFFTGRLASTYGAVDLSTGDVALVQDALLWPVSPTWLDGRLYVLDELADIIAEIDPASLEVLRTFDAGLGANSTLTLSDLTADPATGRLYVSNGGRDTVAELDASNGTVLRTWELGSPVTDADVPGRLELALARGGVIALRNSDGLLRRVDLTTGELTSTMADPRAVRSVVQAKAMDGLQAADDGARVWFGPWAFDPTTLTEVDALASNDLVFRDLGIAGYLAWHPEDSTILWFEASGGVRGRYEGPSAPWGAPALLLRDADGDRGVVFGQFDDATVQYVPLRP